MIAKTLLLLTVVILIAINYAQDQTIRQQKFTIENMLSNPACLVEAPKAPPSTAKQTIKQFVKPTPHYHRVFFKTPNPPQGRV
jgi:hypothetical protein